MAALDGVLSPTGCNMDTIMSNISTPFPGKAYLVRDILFLVATSKNLFYFKS